MLALIFGAACTTLVVAIGLVSLHFLVLPFVVGTLPDSWSSWVEEIGHVD